MKQRKPVSEEGRKRMSAAQRGKQKSAEHRRNISIALAGRPKPEETCKRMAASQRARRHRERLETGQVLAAKIITTKLPPEEKK